MSNRNEQESPSINTNPVYDNFPILNQTNKQKISAEDEGDLIEHELLHLVEQEQEKDQRSSSLPIKQGTISDTSLDVEIESTGKLVHLGTMNNKFKKRKVNGHEFKALVTFCVAI